MAILINSNDDLEIYNDARHLKIYAGPGAGKTYLIVENIKKVIEKSPKLKIEGKKILCITYTNAAADEITQRLGGYNKYVFVSTIHRFIYEHIIKDNQKQLKIIMREKFPINNSTKMEFDERCKLIPRQEGFRLLSKEDEAKIREFVQNEANICIGECSRRAIEECIIDISSYNKYPFDDTKTVRINESKFKDELPLWIKYAIWAKVKKIDFNEILFFGYELVKKYKHIVYSLQYKFPYIFIDEYQDTNPLQNAIIKNFGDCRHCTLSVVGDIAQSIYSFQGATYKEFENFNLKSKNVEEYVINGNRRSTQNIIHFINYFRASDKVLTKQECTFNTQSNQYVTILINKNGGNIFDHMPANTTVLCRRWADVFQYIRNLSSSQQELISKIQDYYTYTKKQDFFTEMEQERIDWIKISSFVVRIKNALENKCMSSILQFTGKFFDNSVFFNEGTGQARAFKTFHQFISRFKGIKHEMKFAEILVKINDWLKELNIVPIEKFEVAKPGDDYYDEKLYEKVNALEFQTLEKMINDVFNQKAKFLTIHRAKGKEFDNVLVNIEPARDDRVYSEAPRNIKADTSSMSEIICNPVIFAENEKPQNEYTRIVYVGLSRAKNNLFLSLGSNIKIGELEAAFQKYMKENNITNKFYRIEEI